MPVPFVTAAAAVALTSDVPGLGEVRTQPRRVRNLISECKCPANARQQIPELSNSVSILDHPLAQGVLDPLDQRAAALSLGLVEVIGAGELGVGNLELVLQPRGGPTLSPPDGRSRTETRAAKEFEDARRPPSQQVPAAARDESTRQHQIRTTCFAPDPAPHRYMSVCRAVRNDAVSPSRSTSRPCRSDGRSPSGSCSSHTSGRTESGIGSRRNWGLRTHDDRPCQRLLHLAHASPRHRHRTR